MESVFDRLKIARRLNMPKTRLFWRAFPNVRLYRVESGSLSHTIAEKSGLFRKVINVIYCLIVNCPKPKVTSLGLDTMPCLRL